MNNFLDEYFCKLKEIFINPELELRVLLNESSREKKNILLSNFKEEEIDKEVFIKYFNRRINREPISKIINKKNFWKYEFFVNNDVLDPRPESELIIEEVLSFFPDKQLPLKILDICTGSGCLAISIVKEYPRSYLTATDISISALNVAKHNANKLGCSNQIKFNHCDLIDSYDLFDVILTNPPYLSEIEFKNTEPEIKLYEPKIALVGGNDGFDFYLKIAKILHKSMDKKSRAFIEIGALQAKKTTEIFKTQGLECIKVAKDLYNLDRVLILKSA